MSKVHLTFRELKKTLNYEVVQFKIAMDKVHRKITMTKPAPELRSSSNKFLELSLFLQKMKGGKNIKLHTKLRRSEIIVEKK